MGDGPPDRPADVSEEDPRQQGLKHPDQVDDGPVVGGVSEEDPRQQGLKHHHRKPDQNHQRESARKIHDNKD